MPANRREPASVPFWFQSIKKKVAGKARSYTKAVRGHGPLLLKFLNEQSLLQVLLDPVITRAAAVDDQVV